MSFGLTVDALCDRVRRDAQLGVYGPVYSLASGVSASATSLVLNEAPEHITVGSFLAVDAEMYRVTAIDSGSSTVSVIPGFHGTTTAAHNANALVEQDPRVPKASLLDWAQHEIGSWKKQLFRVQTVELAVDSTERTYDLPTVTDIDFLLEVRAAPTGAGAQMDDYGASWTGDSWPRVEARLLRDMTGLTGTPFTGTGLQLTLYPRSTTTLRVVYASAFDLSTFDLTTDLVADVGLEEGHLDVLEQGLRWRTLSSGIVARTDWRGQGMIRDAEEVSLLDIVRAVDMARSLRDRRMSEEALALRSRYPYLSM